MKLNFKKKDLGSILAPLYDINNKLSEFISNGITEQEENVKKIEELEDRNKIIFNDINQADVVKNNIKNILGV